MRVLINASAASKGGALTILNDYLEAKVDASDHFFVLSPVKPVVAGNITWIKIKTNGLSTFMFTIFFVYFFYLKFGCNKIISFNNINILLPAKKVSYFHNLLILSDPAIKYKVIRFAIKYLNQKKSHYIFQTQFVADSFIERFGFKPSYQICWPGVTGKYFGEEKNGITDVINNCRTRNKSALIWPASDTLLQHKNFSLLFYLAEQLVDVDFFVPADANEKYFRENIHFLGVMEQKEFLNLLGCSDGVVVTSTLETVCLPIFEAINLGKVAFVLNRPYVAGITAMFPDIKGLHIFNTLNEAVVAINSLDLNMSSNFLGNAYFNVGNWEF